MVRTPEAVIEGRRCGPDARWYAPTIAVVGAPDSPSQPTLG
jgi:hypothetical protein